MELITGSFELFIGPKGLFALCKGDQLLIIGYCLKGWITVYE